jgi:hypothetical protein
MEVPPNNGVAHTNGKRAKLHGRAFYESIGSPKLVLAPMVEQSEFVCFLRVNLQIAATSLESNHRSNRHGACYLAHSSLPRSRQAC